MTHRTIADITLAKQKDIGLVTTAEPGRHNCLSCKFWLIATKGQKISQCSHLAVNAHIGHEFWPMWYWVCKFHESDKPDYHWGPEIRITGRKFK